MQSAVPARGLSVVSPAMYKVFVYGTLKKGEPNHNWLDNPGHGVHKFVSVAKTKTKFPLVIASRYNIPYLLDVPGEGRNIQGEVYEVDDRMLEKLDELEDHPRYYERRPEEVILESGEAMTAWIYLLKKYKPEMLKLPCLEDYRSEGDHGKTYVPRYMRDEGIEYYVDVQS